MTTIPTMNLSCKIDNHPCEKILTVTALQYPHLLHQAQRLESIGNLALSKTNLVYLKISDQYIHQLYPLLADQQILKPSYFSDDGVGAHISVIYPEENQAVFTEDLGQAYQFTVAGIFKAQLELKTYYAIKIAAPLLTSLRKKYGLSEKPCFKSHPVDFHITIGIQENCSQQT